MKRHKFFPQTFHGAVWSKFHMEVKRWYTHHQPRCYFGTEISEIGTP